jgi:hypothetical protein
MNLSITEYPSIKFGDGYRYVRKPIMLKPLNAASYLLINIIK